MSTTAIEPAQDRDSGRVALADVAPDDVVWEGAPHPAGPGSRAGGQGTAVDRLTGLLGSMDHGMAQAIALMREARVGGAAERQSGLPLERLVSLSTGRTGAEVRFMSRAERVLVHLPSVGTAFGEGRLSWSQVRGIVTAAKGLRVAQMAALDGELADEIGQGEPDRIVQRAFGWADLIAADDQVAAVQDPGERKSFRVQPDLFGGAVYYGYDRLDAVTTILEAAEAAADDPAKPDDVHLDADGNEVPAELLPSTARAAQLAEGLRRVAADYLGGGGNAEGGVPSEDRSESPSAGRRGCGPTRPPQPSVSIVIDHRDALTATGRALARWTGGPIRLTRLTIDRLMCDPSVTVVLADGGRPVAVGDATSPITSRHYRTLRAVDLGCRMPGCDAPPQHCDAHHVVPRQSGGETGTDNLVLVCRDCHSRIHTHRLGVWLNRHTRAVTLTLPDGRSFTSLPV